MPNASSDDPRCQTCARIVCTKWRTDAGKVFSALGKMMAFETDPDRRSRAWQFVVVAYNERADGKATCLAFQSLISSVQH